VEYKVTHCLSIMTRLVYELSPHVYAHRVMDDDNGMDRHQMDVRT